MKRRNSIYSYIAFILFLGGMILPSSAYAVDDEVRSEADIVWKEDPNPYTGLYTTKINAVGKALSFAVDGLYYYGDMETAGFSLQDPNFNNLSAHLSLNVHQRVHTVLKMRYTLGGGFMRGSKGSGSRKFDSYNGKVAVGVEYFPFPKLGLYLYAGFAAQYNYINYDIYGNRGVRHTVFPLVPIELGYNFMIKRSWQIGVHIGVSQGLTDTPNINLDGWPTEDLGGIIYDPTNENDWADGYMFLGISISYSWHNNETCRCEW